MKHQKNRIVTVIRYSCLTGKAVWIYQGPSGNAANLAYWRACKKEIERVKRWTKTAKRRRENVERFVSHCTERLPITAKLTAEQTEAAKMLKSIRHRDSPCHREFYNHIMEERRRRKEDREIRRKMREREAEAKRQKEKDNMSYDK